MNGESFILFVHVALKLTLLLSMAWAGNALLVCRNPRWRTLLWRSTVFGIVILVVTAVRPPLYTIPIIAHQSRSAPSTQVEVATPVRTIEPVASKSFDGDQSDTMPFPALLQTDSVEYRPVPAVESHDVTRVEEFQHEAALVPPELTSNSLDASPLPVVPRQATFISQINWYTAAVVAYFLIGAVLLLRLGSCGKITYQLKGVTTQRSSTPRNRNQMESNRRRWFIECVT